MTYGNPDSGGEATGRGPAGISVVAAAVVEEGRLLLVSKKAAPDLFYLPGGKPEPGESAEETLLRELDEELGVTPAGLTPLGTVDDVAVLEGVPMRLIVFRATLTQVPRPAAELARLHWLDTRDPAPVRLAPAIARHVLPLLTAADAGPA